MTPRRIAPRTIDASSAEEARKAPHPSAGPEAGSGIAGRETASENTGSATGSPAYGETLTRQAAGQPKGARTRAHIMSTACTLLDSVTPQDLTVSRICAAAGIAHGTFYIHFADKTVLLAELLDGFVAHVQVAMRRAGRAGPTDPVRAATAAYAALFAHNRGLMRCLIHHLDGFPDARAAFHDLNRAWVETVVVATRRRLARAGRADAIADAELYRRAYALGGMVDQYFASLYLSGDPGLEAVSRDPDAVIETLSLIWDRGMKP
ncbi:TetR/AcrR family transcriptional regulator [Stappia sp.]|uniref:TetR/AcrR family transcriptional regulator n=1 Tax=Stappia sp. TaxID=1870903 RepID=UPI0032D94FF6